MQKNLYLGVEAVIVDRSHVSTDKNESLALLFKIFTRIWVLSKQASSEEPDIHVEERLAGK